MRKLRFAVMAALIVAASSVAVGSQDASAYASSGGDVLADITDQEPVLSPMWGGRIRRWSKQIEREATASGLDPDFIAAVVDSESNGDQYAISRAGAVGLMGVMPAGPGLSASMQASPPQRNPTPFTARTWQQVNREPRWLSTWLRTGATTLITRG